MKTSNLYPLEQVFGVFEILEIHAHMDTHAHFVHEHSLQSTMPWV